jgi:hypothetical protein
MRSEGIHAILSPGAETFGTPDKFHPDADGRSEFIHGNRYLSP